MHLKPILSDGEPLRAFLSVIAEWVDRDTSARQELAPNFDVFWIQKSNEVLHNDVHTVFMEIAMISEAKQIKFERFAFNEICVGYI